MAFTVVLHIAGLLARGLQSVCTHRVRAVAVLLPASSGNSGSVLLMIAKSSSMLLGSPAASG
jgi:hypothetical protein